MEWELIAVDGAVGALAGLIGVLIARRFKESAGNRAKIIQVACVVAGLTLGQQLVYPIVKHWETRRELHASMLEMYGNEESAALNTSILLPILHDPRFKKRLDALHARAAGDPSAPLQGAQTGVAELVGAGLARVDANDLAALFNVKRALADKSPALCAGFWSGHISTLELKDGLRGLGKEQQSVWITVSGRALSKEVAADGPPPPAPAGTAGPDAMAELHQMLSPEQQAAFAAADQGVPTQAIACRAFLALAAGLEKLPTDKRDTILRILSAAPTGGP
jgi:hypothetical protein